jgi:hypothetical protein
MDKEPEKEYYSKVVCAYENFIDFLNDDDAVIDHTYLWDLVCMSNKYIFGQDGINLVIFEIPNDDITNKNRYSKQIERSVRVDTEKRFGQKLSCD